MANKTTTPRSLSTIAMEIKKEWKKPYFGAVPYLDAMVTLETINDMYLFDTAYSIVSYFLANAGTWRGDKARAIKAELKAILNSK